jgi:hypothetical protein
MAIDTGKIDLLIQYALLVAGEEDDYFDRQLGPIHIIKYVYLADLSFAKRNEGKSFTGIDWQFYKFGPWSQAVNARIEPALKAINANKTTLLSDYGDKEDWVRWSFRDGGLLDRKRQSIPSVITSELKKNIHKYKQDTPSLLNHVYRTKPMLYAAPNEYLDLSLVVENTPKDEESEITQPLLMDRLPNKKKIEFKEKMAELRKKCQERFQERKEKLVVPTRNPKYDRVFEEGVKSLDSLAGEPFPTGEFIVKFSDDVWKSEARRGQENELS